LQISISYLGAHQKRSGFAFRTIVRLKSPSQICTTTTTTTATTTQQPTTNYPTTARPVADAKDRNPIISQRAKATFEHIRPTVVVPFVPNLVQLKPGILLRLCPSPMQQPQVSLES